MTLPFEDSRRLTGPNLYFAEPGAVLETVGPGAEDAGRLTAWQANIARMRAALAWPDAPLAVRPHRGGAALAIAAPVDQLFTATEVNEWAWLAACGEAGMYGPGHPIGTDLDESVHTLRRLATAERRPDLQRLLDAARRAGLPTLLDEDQVTLGLGNGSCSWPLTALPSPDAVPWNDLHSIPSALVTGSNGKTTTVRLLAALLRAHGLRTAHSCTDGVFFDAERLHTGDYSGPAGARSVLRHPQVEAAVLETARGGLLRRGLAVERADAAIVTNISVDHFGEYGIDDLAGLTAAKLIVARALDEHGVLVLNADDPQLSALATGTATGPAIAWFALDDDHPLLVEHRGKGGRTCAGANGQLWLSYGNERHDLGPICAMPLTAGGHAGYNVANIAGGVLLAHAMGVSPATIRAVIADFGRARSDNPGRLEQWRFGGITVLMDYAHNPDGLRGLLEIARSAADGGRIGLILGQAGNRHEPEIRALAATAAAFRPALVVLKDMDGYLRGRADGEVAALLRDELLQRGLPETALPVQLKEIDAALLALSWARDGDVLVLPVHALAAKAEVAALLDRLEANGWAAGDALR